MMILPMLIVVHGNPLFNNDDSIARWEQTVTSMLKNDAANAINTSGQTFSTGSHLAKNL